MKKAPDPIDRLAELIQAEDEANLPEIARLMSGERPLEQARRTPVRKWWEFWKTAPPG